MTTSQSVRGLLECTVAAVAGKGASTRPIAPLRRPLSKSTAVLGVITLAHLVHRQPGD